ncbi:hypothetical protein [Oleiharenicola sp. Vm1]|uniref:hypothetical protein n=1 Tax=Oleiharenicola sp. Vm1 TaxID=3398393 RepID=UPI0039F55BC7
MTITSSATWVPYDVMTRDWYDTSSWSPDPSTVPYGQSFTQSKNQQRDWERGEYLSTDPTQKRYQTVYYTNQTIYQSATGTQVTWTPYNIMTRDWYDTSSWSPDPSTVPYGQSFTQTKNQQRDWEQGEVSNLGGKRNVSTYNTYQTLSQPATGTQLQGQSVSISPVSQTVTVGAAVTFTASGGQNGYVWGGSSGASGSGSTKAVTFNSVGTVTVTVYSPAGGAYTASNTASATVTVVAAPTATLSRTINSGAYPGNVTLNWSTTNATSATVSGPGFTGAQAVSVPSGSSTLGSLAPGTYSWTLTATNSAGATATSTASATITQAGQTVSISPTSSTVVAGGSVTFTASGAQSSAGYTWGGSSGASGSGSTKAVSFPTAGTYTVTVQSPADTNYSASNTASASVTVVNPTGNVTLSVSSLDFGSVYRDTLAGTPTTATRTVTLSNPGNSTVTVTAIGVSGKYASSSLSLPYTLTPGASVTLTLTFGPNAAIGSNTGTLTVTASSNTATCSLTGTGLAPRIGISWF